MTTNNSINADQLLATTSSPTFTAVTAGTINTDNITSKTASTNMILTSTGHIFLEHIPASSIVITATDGSAGILAVDQIGPFLGSNVKFTGGLIYKTRVITAAGAVTTTALDNIVIINKTVGAATAVSVLTAGSFPGQVYIIKDGKGDAATNNITITPVSGNIDGASSYVMNSNYQSITLVDNGTQYNII